MSVVALEARYARRRERNLGRRVRPQERAALILLAGPLWCIAFGRWGAQLGLPAAGLFVPEVLVLLGAGQLLLERMQGRLLVTTARHAASSVALGLLGLYAVVSIARGQGGIVLIARDSAPLIYLLAIPPMCWAIALLSFERLYRLLRAACVLHLLWGLPSSLLILPPLRLLPEAIAAVPLFQLRNDYDGAIFALTFLLGLMDRRARTALTRLLTLGAVVALIAQASRAGLLALPPAALAAVLVLRPWQRNATGFALVGGLLVCVTASGILAVTYAQELVPQSGVVARFGLSRSEAAAGLNQSAQNTADARRQAWRAVMEYTEDNNFRMFGAGPGAEIVAESGAVAYLSGDLSVRAPHNWAVSLYSRFGAVGTALWIAVILSLLFRPPSRRRAPVLPASDDERLVPRLAALGAGLAAGVITAGILGVVIESSFGSWSVCLGLALFAQHRSAAMGLLRLPNARLEADRRAFASRAPMLRART